MDDELSNRFFFDDSVDRLSKRIDPASPLSFDKDDDDTLDFVVAAANLRASVFDIESQTRFQVKGSFRFHSDFYSRLLSIFVLLHMLDHHDDVDLIAHLVT